MRIQMTTIECGPAGNFQPGDEREVSAEQGTALVFGGYAIALSPSAPEQAVLLPELSTPPAPERATAKKPETRKKKAAP